MLTAALARYLHEQGHVRYGTDDTNAFLEDLPGHVVDAVGIYAEAGVAAALPGHRRPGVQIIVRRAVDSPAGRARSGYKVASDLLSALDGLRRVTWGEGTEDAVRVAWCLAVQSAPVDLGTDETGAPRWSVRFQVQLAEDAA